LGVRIDYNIFIALLTTIIGLKSVLDGVFGDALFSIIILALRWLSEDREFFQY